MQKTIAPVVLALLLSTNFLTIFSHGLLGLGSRFTGGVIVALITILVLHGWRRWCV